MFATVCTSGNLVNHFKKNSNRNIAQPNFLPDFGKATSDNFNKQALKFGTLSSLQYRLNEIKNLLNRKNKQREKIKNSQGFLARFSHVVQGNETRKLKKLNKEIKWLEKQEKALENQLGINSSSQESFSYMPSSQSQQVRSDVATFLRSSL